MSLTVKFDLKPLSPDDPEFEEIQAAVQEGLKQADRGELYPAGAVFAESPPSMAGRGAGRGSGEPPHNAATV